jgi:integral membrane protein
VSNLITDIVRSEEPTQLKALRLTAIVEGASFVVLLVCSLLKRTTDFNAVPAMGGIHGMLFILLVALVVENWRRLGWSVPFAVVMLTVGSPGAHFAVSATEIRPEPPSTRRPRQEA